MAFSAVSSFVLAPKLDLLFKRELYIVVVKEVVVCATVSRRRRSSICCGRLEVKVSEGIAVPDACRRVGVSDKSYYRWHKLYSSISSTEVKRYKELEKENYRLKQIMADLELDKRILKEALDFLGHKA